MMKGRPCLSLHAALLPSNNTGIERVSWDSKSIKCVERLLTVYMLFTLIELLMSLQQPLLLIILRAVKDGSRLDLYGVGTPAL